MFWLCLAVGVEDQSPGLVDGSLPGPLPQASEGGAPRGALSRRTPTPTLLRARAWPGAGLGSCDRVGGAEWSLCALAVTSNPQDILASLPWRYIRGATGC